MLHNKWKPNTAYRTLKWPQLTHFAIKLEASTPPRKRIRKGGQSIHLCLCMAGGKACSQPFTTEKSADNTSTAVSGPVSFTFNGQRIDTKEEKRRQD